LPHSPAGKARHSLIVRYLSRGDVGRVPAQMWAESRRRCGPSPGADVAESRRRCGPSRGADVGESWRRCGPSPGADVGRCGQMGALCELRDLVRSQRNVEEFDLRRLS
jgi:hypothetical protein